jgi:hypothetical protein
MLNGVTLTCDVELLDDTLALIDSVQATFSLVTLNGGEVALETNNVEFTGIASGTVVRAINVQKGTTVPYEGRYIDTAEFSGDTASRTIGPAGGNAIITQIRIVNP